MTPAAAALEFVDDLIIQTAGTATLALREALHSLSFRSPNAEEAAEIMTALRPKLIDLIRRCLREDVTTDVLSRRAFDLAIRVGFRVMNVDLKVLVAPASPAGLVN